MTMHKFTMINEMIIIEVKCIKKIRKINIYNK